MGWNLTPEEGNLAEQQAELLYQQFVDPLDTWPAHGEMPNWRRRIDGDAWSWAYGLAGARFPFAPPDPIAVKRWERFEKRPVGVVALILLWFVGPVVVWVLGTNAGPGAAFLSIPVMFFLFLWWARSGKADRPPSPISHPSYSPYSAALHDAVLEHVHRLHSAASRSQRETDLDVLRRSVDGRWQPHGPRPSPCKLATPRDAEHLAAAWMKFLGGDGVHVTPSTRDGGIDVRCKGFVAQVKHQAAPVSPSPVHQIFGVGISLHASALFFSTSGYSGAATEFANDAGVALFVMDAASGTLAPRSTPARHALQSGLRGISPPERLSGLASF